MAGEDSGISKLDGRREFSRPGGRPRARSVQIRAEPSDEAEASRALSGVNARPLMPTRVTFQVSEDFAIGCIQEVDEVVLAPHREGFAIG